MDGMIFDIKEFSIHDGPGCRVTVFLKGCPLRCLWCHNPEGLSAKRQLMYKKKRCSNCGLCRRECGHMECRELGRCIHVCPNGCLSVAGERISAESLAEKLLKNTEFFGMTGGGITISGGEPLMQSKFVCEIAERLPGIHKALQTSGYAEPDVYRQVVDKFDYIMQDIKLADPDLHRKYTGVSNEQILHNVEYLKQSGKDLVFRVPMIPGITDTEENLTAIAELTDGFSVEYLLYNTLAGAKYEMLGMQYHL